MKKVLKILIIALLVIATTFVVACDDSKPWDPPKNQFGDGYDGGIGDLSPGMPDGDDFS